MSTVQTILSSSQAKKARETLSLSQGKVIGDLDLKTLNRSYLSLFESGKRLLADDELTALRNYYEELGFEFNDSPTLDCNGIRLMDSFAIPDNIDSIEAEILLSEYAENKAEIQRLANESIDKGFFSGIDEDDRDQKTRKILCLMARNYSLIEQLHGHETILPCASEEMDLEKDTAGDFLGIEFAEIFGFNDEEKTPEQE